MSKRSSVESILSLLDIETIRKIKAEYFNGKEAKLSFDVAQGPIEREVMLSAWLDHIKWRALAEFKIEIYDGTSYKIKFGD